MRAQACPFLSGPVRVPFRIRAGTLVSPVRSCVSSFCCPYWPGSETVNSFLLDSFLPSPVQIAPLAVQSVVTGRTTVTSASALGVTVICQPVLLPWVSRRALATAPPVTVKAWSRRVW